MKKLKWFLLIGSCICYLCACGSKEIIPEERDLTFQTEDQGGEGPQTIITPTLTKWSMEALQGEIQKVPDIIVAQHQNYSPLSSSSPDFYSKDFASAKEMLTYVGLDVVKIPEWDLEETGNTLSLYGTETGEFKEVHLETDYKTDNLILQVFARIYMDKQDVARLHCLEHSGVTVTMEEYYNQAGKFFLFTTASVSEYGSCHKDAYLVEENVFYNLHIGYKPEYEAEARERLEQWAELWQ